MDQLTNIQRLVFADRAETAPTASASNATAVHKQSFAASALFTVSDAQNDNIVKYQFWDSTSDPASGHWVVNGAAQAANQAIDVSVAQLVGTTFQSGSGADQLYVRASDGMMWGAWQAFIITAPLNHAPVVTATNVTATHGQSTVTASSLIGASDGDGDSITLYGLWDTQGSGHWSVNGLAQATNAEIDLTPAQLAQTSYVFGSAADTLYVRAFDGIAWGDWKVFTATPFADHAPVVTASDFSATHNQNIAASSLFADSDADGDAITSFQFWDSTADPSSGHFVVGGVTQGANQTIDVTAAQLASTTFQSGSGSDDLWVRANDGTMWSAWKEFHVNAPVDQAPVVTASNFSATPNQSVTASSLFSVSDAEHDNIVQYQFWDSTAGAASGHFSVGGMAQGTNQSIDVTAAQLAGTTFQGGTISDDLWLRVNDGMQWSQWQEFHWLV